MVVLALAGGIALAGSLGLPLIGSYNALAPTPQEYPAVAALPSPEQQRDPTPSPAMVMAKEPLEELADFLQQQRLLVEERVEVSQSESATQEVAEYTVQPGDTLGMIAASKGVSPETLARANGITDADAIQIGQVLLIPPVDGVVNTVEEPTQASQSEPLALVAKANHRPSSLTDQAVSATVPSADRVLGSSRTRASPSGVSITYSTSWFCRPVLRSWKYRPPRSTGAETLA